MAQRINYNYYTNPAFSQQSEFIPNNSPSKQTTSQITPKSSDYYQSIRRSTPIGATSTSPHKREVYRASGRQLKFTGPPNYPTPDTHNLGGFVQATKAFSPLRVVDVGYNQQQQSQQIQQHHQQNQQQNQQQQNQQQVQQMQQIRYDTFSRQYQPTEMTEDEKKLNSTMINQLHLRNTTSEPSYTVSRTPTVISAAYKEHVEQEVVVNGHVHRYAMIPTDEEDNEDNYSEEEINIEESSIQEMTPDCVKFNNERHSEHIVDHNQQQKPPHQQPNGIQQSKPIPAPRSKLPATTLNKTTPNTPTKTFNPVATRKLHELLTTPPRKIVRTNSLRFSARKANNQNNDKTRRAISPPPLYGSSYSVYHQTTTPYKHDFPYESPARSVHGTSMYRLPNSPTKMYSPPLSPAYSMPPRGNITGMVTSSPRKPLQTHPMDSHSQRPIGTPQKRTTAVVQPIYLENQSVFSDAVYVEKSNESWVSSSHKGDMASKTLTGAALMLVACGALLSGLSFYVISTMGRKYFLDFSVLTGFTCFVLGLLGFRTRNCGWLPNRNYISGYIVLSVFNLLTSSTLAAILYLRPKTGSPTADVTSGAVCGLSALTLLLASLGVLTSYFCKYPPPDNRVEHSVSGFTV